MRLNKYYITKNSGTYAETLETYGLAKILTHIFESNNKNANILIKDEGGYYCILTEESITEEMVNNTLYFDAYPYMKINNMENENITGWHIDYESEKNKRDIFRRGVEQISKIKDKKERARQFKELKENENCPDPDFDIFSKVRAPNNITVYNKILVCVNENKKDFSDLLKEILALYSNSDNNGKNVNNEIRKWLKVTALQIFNPHQGKGVNSPKSNSIKLGNLKSLWIKEYLKIIGIYESMMIKDIKVSNRSWDTKYYVIDPFEIEYSMLYQIYTKFKPLVSGNTPFKIDILSILNYTEKLIEFIPEYQEKRPFFLRRLKPNNLVQGFRTAYQKNMGQNKSIANIGYLRLPEFVEIGSYEEGRKWIDIIEEHRNIMIHIDENNSSTTSLLQHYRQFLSAGDWDEFFEFYFDYAALLMSDIERRKMYLKAFTIKNLEEMFMTEEKFKPILESQGFRNIAKAIRNATIKEQYAKSKGNQRFEIHYGMAQDLKRKSPYQKDLIEYLSEFIALYNAETARYVEHHSDEFKAGKVRATVKTEDVEDIINLIDEFGSSVVGKLLAAYGYALERRENIPEDNEGKQ